MEKSTKYCTELKNTAQELSHEPLLEMIQKIKEEKKNPRPLKLYVPIKVKLD